MKGLGWIGRLAKAEVKDGIPFLSYLVTGPEEDKQTEQINKAVSDKVSALAAAGGVFLAPSHDVPIPLAKSATASTDDAGHLYIDFQVDQEDPLAMKVFKGYESGDWCPSVSLGAEKVTRVKTFNKALGKAMTEITDIDTSQPVHVALCFPGRNVYPFAGITQAIRKAFSKEPDASELKKRFWPEESIQKAIGGPDGSGWPAGPSFAERWTSKEIQDDLPDMMDLLRYTIEDIVSPYTSGTIPEKRSLVIKSVNEFLDIVLGEVDEVQGAGKSGAPADGMSKTTPIGGKAKGQEKENPGKGPKPDEPPNIPPPVVHPPPTGTVPDPVPPAAQTAAATEPSTEIPPTTEPEAESPAIKAVLAELAKVKGEVEALQKANQQTPAHVVVLPNLTTDPATAPNVSGEGAKAAGTEAARKAVEDRMTALRKAIDATRDASIKAGMIQEHGALLSQLSRMA